MPSTHSHTYTLQPAHAAIGLWVPSRQPARPYLGRAPLRTGPCSSGLSEQRALDPAGGPQSRPRRSRVGAGPELRRGGSLERHRQRGGAAPASESEPRPRLPDARLGRAFWGNCGEGKDSASSSPRSQRAEVEAQCLFQSRSRLTSVTQKVRPPQLPRPP